MIAVFYLGILPTRVLDLALDSIDDFLTSLDAPTASRSEINKKIEIRRSEGLWAGAGLSRRPSCSRLLFDLLRPPLSCPQTSRYNVALATELIP